MIKKEILTLTAGEEQLVRQLRDIMAKMDDKPFTISVVVIGSTWLIYEGVPRGKVRN